jgi:hypothetical protein
MKTILLILLVISPLVLPQVLYSQSDTATASKLQQLEEELRQLKEKVNEGNSQMPSDTKLDNAPTENTEEKKPEDKAEEVKKILLSIEKAITLINKGEDFESKLLITKVYTELEEARKLVKENIKNSNLLLFFEVELNSFENKIKNIITSKNNRAKISVTGDAVLVNSNVEDKSIKGVGLIGLNFLSRDRRSEVTAVINLISSNDTVQLSQDARNNVNSSDFGRSIVNPFSGSNNFTSGLIHGKRYIAKFGSNNYNVGLHFNMGFASQNWKDITSEVVRANIFSGSFGIFWNVLSKDLNMNEEFQLIPFLNFSTRLVLGDIANDSYNDFRSRALGTTDTDFFGGELGFQLKYNQFNAFVMLPLMFGESQVKGITGGQFVAGLSVSTSLKVVEFE